MESILKWRVSNLLLASFGVSPMLYTVRGLEDGAGGIEIRVRVLSKEEPRKVRTQKGEEHTVVDVRVGDRTGLVTLSLWDERADEVDVGEVVDIKNGYVGRFKGRIRLNIGKYGSMEKVEDLGFPSIEEIAERQSFRIQRHKTTSKF